MDSLNESSATLCSKPIDACESESFECFSFKHSRAFRQLEHAVVCSNQLMHKSFDKLDLDCSEGQVICQKYLNYLESLCELYHVSTESREYRSKFSQAYKVLYKEGELSYLTEILDSAQEGFPCLWVNGEKYSFTQEVLNFGTKLMSEFYKLQQCLRDSHSRIMQEDEEMNGGVNDVVKEIKKQLVEFDCSWSTFEKSYVLELMGIEYEARMLITKAIEAEQTLSSVEIREKMKGKILISCDEYLLARSKLCEIINQINVLANSVGKGRDDLDHSILCETEGILRRITKDQSKAVRVLGEKIRNSFSSMRALLKKYDKNIEMVDPQLKNNKDLVDCLVEYEKVWEKGGNYFCDSEKKRYLLHFSGILETIYEKYTHFQMLVEWLSPELFLIVPYILVLKSLDKDDRNLCKYFLPSLNQIDTKYFRTYFEMEKLFEEWKKSHLEHYSYYNILEKILIGVTLNTEEQEICEQKKVLIDKLIKKIQLIGMELHTDGIIWNGFMEVCMFGLTDELF